MHALLKKLNFKNQRQMIILQAPEEFQATIIEFEQDIQVRQDLKDVEPHSVEFILIFVKSQEEVRQASEAIDGALQEDALLWFAYPKKSSKKYKANISRDDGWQALGELGYEGVRLVSIDDDWSALRFRPVEKIKSMTRNPKIALSEKGKERTS